MAGFQGGVLWYDLFQFTADLSDDVCVVIGSKGTDDDAQVGQLGFVEHLGGDVEEPLSLSADATDEGMRQAHWLLKPQMNIGDRIAGEIYSLSGQAALMPWGNGHNDTASSKAAATTAFYADVVVVVMDVAGAHAGMDVDAALPGFLFQSGNQATGQRLIEPAQPGSAVAGEALFQYPEKAAGMCLLHGFVHGSQTQGLQKIPLEFAGDVQAL